MNDAQIPNRRRFRDATDRTDASSGAVPAPVTAAPVDLSRQAVATRLTALQRLGYRMLIVSIVLCDALAAFLVFAPSETSSQSHLSRIVWTLLLLTMAVTWRKASDRLRRAFLYTIVLVLFVRWTSAWFGSDDYDRIIAVLTANMILPALLIITAMIHERRTGLVIGAVTLALYAGVGLVGSLRPELDGEPLADWPLGALHAGMNGVLLMMVGWLARTRDEFVVSSAHSIVLLEAAVRDPLTGLFNRRGLEMVLEEGPWHTSDVVVALIDIDHFKRVNDTFGHDEGDAVLRRSGTALLGAVGPDDLVGRLGGEEFLVATRGRSVDEATDFVDRIRRSIAAANDGITASAGWTYWSRGSESHAAARTRADAALYEAKRTGRDRTVRWVDGDRTDEATRPMG